MPTIKKNIILSPVEHQKSYIVNGNDNHISFIGHDRYASIFPFISVLTNPNNRDKYLYEYSL